MHYDRLTDAMKPLSKGLFGMGKKGLVLEDHRFEKTIFNSVQNPPPLNQSYILRRVTFDRCITEIGPFRLSTGWELEDVSICKMKAWRVLISAQVPLRNVKITSYAKAGRLEILPSISTENLPCRQFDLEDYELDVSEYKGDLRIMGINAAAVKIDPARQFRLRLTDPKLNSSEVPGLDPQSLMSIALNQMKGWCVRDAILSLPAPKDKNFEQEKHALGALIQAGIAF